MVFNAIMVRMTNGDPLLSRVLTALLLVSLSFGALPCADAAGGESGSSSACCARDNSGGDTLEPGSDSDVAGGSWSCPGVCPGTALPSIVSDPAGKGAVAPPGPPNDWIAGRSLAPDPFPPNSLYLT